MRASEIETYDDLTRYIKLEVSRQTQTKKIVILELPEAPFKKFLKLVKFYLRDNKNEKQARLMDSNIANFQVKINGFTTKVTRK